MLKLKMDLEETSEKKIIEKAKTAYGLDNKFMGNYSSVNEPNHSYNALVLNRFLELLPKEKNKKPLVLELASGLGMQADYLEETGVEVIRTDMSTSSVRYNKSTSSNLVIQANMWSLPFVNTCFDGVHIKDGLVHVPNLNRFFSELERVLKHNGVVCITTETNSNPINTWIRNLVSQSFFRIINVADIIESAKVHRLREVEAKKWKPTKNEKDWYIQSNSERQVIYLQKNLETLSSSS